MTDGKVILDASVFKALASDSRVRILKVLDERQKTISEICREVDISKATVHEHLNVLVDAGLVERRDTDARKWVYYRLTWKGTGIVSPEKKKVAFFLALSTTFFFAGFVYLLVLVGRLADRTRTFDALQDQGAEGGLIMQAARATPVATFWDLAGAAALIVTAGVLVAIAVTELRGRRKDAVTITPEENA